MTYSSENCSPENLIAFIELEVSLTAVTMCQHVNVVSGMDGVSARTIPNLQKVGRDRQGHHKRRAVRVNNWMNPEGNNLQAAHKSRTFETSVMLSRNRTVCSNTEIHSSLFAAELI